MPRRTDLTAAFKGGDAARKPAEQAKADKRSQDNRAALEAAKKKHENK